MAAVVAAWSPALHTAGTPHLCPRAAVAGSSSSASAVVCMRHRATAAIIMMADTDDLPSDEGMGDLEKELAAQLETREFNKDLYEHLGKRPEYETSELYAALRKRQDVDDPLYSELEKRRATGATTPMPNSEQTPGEVIELVLRALRDVDWPSEGHGVDVLQNYSGPGSILGEDRPDVTAQILLDYFASSRYVILLNWVAIQYTRKLELSFDKKRALQRLRLTSSEGDKTELTFQLSKHQTAQGLVWLIDQLLVKS